MGALDGRVALITGGAKGIGLGIAKKFAEEGASLILTDIGDPAGDMPDGALFITHDVTDEAGWDDVVAQGIDAFGGIDILVNNAGIAGGGPIEMMTPDEFRQIMAINVEGVYLGTRAVLQSMKERAPKWKGGCSVINISSIMGLVGAGGASAYCASKGAVRLFTKSCALEFAGAEYGIRVNSIHPGFIETDMARQAAEMSVAFGNAGSDNEARDMLVERHALGRLGYVEEIAEGALYLASDRSSFTTGSELVIDGGYTAT